MSEGTVSCEPVTPLIFTITGNLTVLRISVSKYVFKKIQDMSHVMSIKTYNMLNTLLYYLGQFI